MIVFFVFLLIFLSRVLLLSISPSFFDSIEYIRLFNSPALIEALKQVHYPVHPLWITVGWLFNKIPISTTLFKIEFLNAVLGTICCFLIYKIAQEFTEKNKAILITLICAFTPYFWLSQINVLYEPLLGVLLLGAFWLLSERKERFKGRDKGGIKGKLGVIAAGIFFAGAVLVSPTALVYLIFLAGVLLKRKRGLGLLGGLAILGGVILSILSYLSILKLRGVPAREIFAVLSAGNSILAKVSAEGIMFFVRGARNSLVVYFNYLTVPVGGILSCLSILSFLRKKNRLLIICWLITFFLLNTVWHAGMFGRLSLFLTLIPIFLLAKIKSMFLLKLIAVFLIIFSSFKVFPYHFQKIPDVLEKEYLQEIGGNTLLIMSNFEEPYLKETVAEYRVLNSPKTNIEEIEGWLKEKLKKGETVLITSQAISAPYFQYDGMNYNLLSKKRRYPQTQGQIIVRNYKLKTLKKWKKFDLELFTLTDGLDFAFSQ